MTTCAECEGRGTLTFVTTQFEYTPTEGGSYAYNQHIPCGTCRGTGEVQEQP